MSGLNNNSYSDNVGQAALWTGFGFTIFALVVFLGITALNSNPKNTVFYYLVSGIAGISSLAYLIEALGNSEMSTGRFDSNFTTLPNGQIASQYKNWVDWFFPQFLGPLVASGVVVGTSPTTWISALSGVTLSSASLSSIASFLNVEATSAAVTSAMTTLSNTYASLPVNTLEPVTRYLEWLRYAQWAASTPLVIALLGLLAGTTTTELLYTTMLALITTGGLFAAAISTGYNATWPIFALAIIAAVPVAYQVLFVWASRTGSLHKATASTFAALSWVSFFLAIGYAVNWGTAEGGRVQTTSQEILTYTVLDVMSRVVVPFALVFIPNAIEGAAGLLTEYSHSALAKTSEASSAAPSTV